MGSLTSYFVCGLLLPPLIVAQHVVTVSVGTCLPSLGSLISTGGPGPSALTANAGVISSKSDIETSATASTPSTPSSTPPGFLISYQAPANGPLLRRDDAKFPMLDGQSTSACIHSPLFNVDSIGQLSVVNAGTSLTYSTSPGKVSAPFAPSSNVGNVSTAWQLAAGTLSWKNSLFLNGTASLCSDPSGAIQAYFLEPIPADCTPISLSQASVYTCPGYFEANPNGLLASFTPSSSLPGTSLASSTSVMSGDNTASSDTESSSTDLITSQSIGLSSSESSSTIAVASQISSLSSSGASSASTIISQMTGFSGYNSSSPSIATSSNGPSVAGNSSIPVLPASSASSLTSPFITNIPTSVSSIITSSLPGISNSSAIPVFTPTSVFATPINTTSLLGFTSSSISLTSIIPPPPGISNSTSIPSVINTPPIIGASSSNTTSLITALSSSSSSLSSSSSSSSGPSSSILTSLATDSSSVPTSSTTAPVSSTSVSSSSSSFIQVTSTTTISSGSSLYTTFLNTASQTVIEEIVQPTPAPVTVTSTITSGSSLYTTFLNTAGQTVTEEIVQPTPFTTTITSGSSFYTTSTILPNGQEEVEVIKPQLTTTITSYTATTTIFTATATGTDGEVTVTVVQPTPGLQYFGFQDPGDAGKGTQPDSSQFNNDASQIDIQGVFPGSIDFYTADDGSYQFPGQTTATQAANYVVVFEGYFYGPEGQYSITLSTQNDDYGFIWTDSQAYSGFNNGNAEVTESIGGGYTQNHTFALAAGDFLPVTIMWMNVYLAGGVRFLIYPPTGDSTNDTTGYFAQPYTGDAFVYHLPPPSG